MRGEKQFHGNNRGLLHKFAHVRYRITGDKLSVTRTIKAWQPKTVKGKLFRANARAVNFAVHDAGQTATVRDYSLKRQFGYEMTGWNNESDGLCQGIKVYCNNGDTLKAPFKCKISEVNTDENKIKLRKDDVEYWYDGTGGTKRDTPVALLIFKATPHKARLTTLCGVALK